MAKAKRAVKGPKMCECESTKIRKAFKAANTCSSKARVLDTLKQAANADYEHLKPGARRLLYRELLQKAQQVQDLCAREEASDASRFSGISRRRRRRARR